MKARFISVLLVGAALAGEARATSLSGTVRDAVTLAPVAGAQLTLQILNPDSISVPMTSDSQGRFEATGIVTGNQIYVLYGYAPGYQPLYARLDALSANDVSYDALMTLATPPGPQPDPPDSGEFTGSVWSRGASNNLVPVMGASVVLTSGATRIEAQTDVHGHYSSALLPLGTYSIQFRAPGYGDLVMPGVALDAAGVVVDGVLGTSPTPVAPKTWGSVKATYR